MSALANGVRLKGLKPREISFFFDSLTRSSNRGNFCLPVQHCLLCHWRRRRHHGLSLTLIECTKPPKNRKFRQNVAPLKKRSCQAIFSFSMAALFLISAILLLFYVSRLVSFLVLIITSTGGAANILEIITKFLGSPSISTSTQVSQSSKIEADI